MSSKKEEELRGLSESEARTKLGKHGHNEVEDKGKTSIPKILFRQIKSNFMIYILTVATIISFFVGKDLTAYVIIAVIFIVISVGFIQEYKAEKAIEALKKMITPHSIVIRGGREKKIPSRNIVPGDILVLKSGEKVPADCVVINEKELLLNESVLTGESKEVPKSAAKNLEKYKDENALFMGSFVVSGKCQAKVVKTGMDTKFGKIAGMISKSEKELPLQKKVNRIIKYLAIAGGSMAILTGIIMLLHEPTINEEVIIAVLMLVIAVAVASFPEGFPVVLITSLASGAYQMANKNAIVNRMSIIETLGETTVICSDKTGTITRGEMTAKELFTGHRKYEIEGVGYNSKGGFKLDDKKINPKKEHNLDLILKASVLCNEAKIQKTHGSNFKVLGAPTEAALLVMAAKGGLTKEKMKYSVLDEIPFSSEKKMMAVLVEEGKEKNVYVKGALEVLLKKCSFVQKNDKTVRLTKKDKDELLKMYKDMTSRALRTISLAYKKGKKNEKMDSKLVFLGLVGIEDPPRKEIEKSLRFCSEAGIKVKMITGDNKETAMAIADQIKLEKGDVLEGKDLDKISDKKLVKVVQNTVVFARVDPKHKSRIVKALRKSGEIVTVTGDGVNDAPALKDSHIGVAMGKAGTDVSRSVADLTLKDDNFATIVDAIEEGRNIFRNIQKFANYQISVNFSQVSLIFLAVLIGMPLPLIALQILFMNLFSDELTALTLAFNPHSKDLMEDEPRKKSKIVSAPSLMLLAIAGLIMAVGSLLVFYYTHTILEKPEELARTMTFVTMVFFGITNAYNFRSFRSLTLNRSPFTNKYLVYASIIAILGTLAIVYIPFFNLAFETVPISPAFWGIAALMSLSVIVFFDLVKYINHKKHLWSEDLQELNLKAWKK